MLIWILYYTYAFLSIQQFLEKYWCFPDFCLLMQVLRMISHKIHSLDQLNALCTLLLKNEQSGELKHGEEGGDD